MSAEMLESADVNVLRLTGSWTIERACELKQLLLESLSDEQHLMVDLREVVEVDLSFLQLLCSAHRTFWGRNKPFSLQDSKPDVIKAFVKNAGYARTLGCHRAGGGGCLWIGGWES